MQSLTLEEFIQKELDKYKGEGKLMPNYGWVQNTSNLSTIRDTVELIGDTIVSHNELMRRIIKNRVEQNDLGEKGKWTWDARCRIKAICASGMAEIDRSINGYRITELGKNLLKQPKSDKFYKKRRILSLEEISIFRKGLLSNPPVVRILQILNEDRRNGGIGLSKYDVGRLLGFVGDVGFTHIEPEYVVRCKGSFNKKEGTADKWARTIISWLIQVKWVKEAGKIDVYGKELLVYTTTDEVDKVLRYDVKSTIKYIPSEMLCSKKHPFSKVIQIRRAYVLEMLRKSSIISKAELVNNLIEKGIDIDEETLEFDIINLRQAGVQIFKEGNCYTLKDKIKLDICSSCDKKDVKNGLTDIDKTIEQYIIKYADSLPARLVEDLVRYGNGGPESANMFEISVEKFFTNIGYDAKCLGQGHGRVADVIACYKADKYANSYGLIIDAKAYSRPYSFPSADVRKMKEYIELHGNELLEDKIPKHAFVFISSSFQNQDEKLKEISEATGIDGTAIEIYKLLEFGDKVNRREIKIAETYGRFINNTIFDIS